MLLVPVVIGYQGSRLVVWATASGSTSKLHGRWSVFFSRMATWGQYFGGDSLLATGCYFGSGKSSKSQIWEVEQPAGVTGGNPGGTRGCGVWYEALWVKTMYTTRRLSYDKFRSPYTLNIPSTLRSVVSRSWKDRPFSPQGRFARIRVSQPGK